MNLAFITKLGWRLVEERNTLWVQVLSSKYMQGQYNVRNIKHKPGASIAWQGISNTVEILNKGNKMVARNGRSTYFWCDRWLANEPLINMLNIDIQPTEKQKKVHAYWINGQGWNWEALNGIYQITGRPN